MPHAKSVSTTSSSGLGSEPLPPVQYYFDTYALVERQSGNPAYTPYASAPVFCHQTNLLEFAAWVMRVSDEARARKELRLLDANLIEATIDDLIDAAAFHGAQRRQNVSYIDALGYTLAQRHGMRFLTGDKAFKGRDGVEYVA